LVLKRGQSDVVGVGSAAKTKKILNKRLINDPINQLIQESQPNQKISHRSDL